MRTAFAGSEYVPHLDDQRLQGQIKRVRDALIDGRYRTLREIHEITGDGEASISAQIRHLRKQHHGGYVIDRRIRGDRVNGLFEYAITGQAQAGTLF